MEIKKQLGHSQKKRQKPKLLQQLNANKQVKSYFCIGNFMLEEIFKTLEGLSKQAMLYPKQRKDNPNF